NILKQSIADISASLEKIENKKYPVAKYIELFSRYSRNIFIDVNEKNEGIYITEQPHISQVSFKRLYQVGMTSKHFPSQEAKNTFSYFSQEFKPVQTSDIQLYTFVELLNKTRLRDDFQLRLSYPVIIENEE